MPLYEYQCATCHKVHEVMQKFSDEPLKTCPDCEGVVTKLISMTSFSLKGTGWYATDYKKSGKPAVTSSASSEPAPASAAPAAATPAVSTAPAAAPATTPKKSDS